jgi:hypothetical protein
MLIMQDVNVNTPPPRPEKQSKQQAASKLPRSPRANSPHSHSQVLRLKRALARPLLPEVSCIPCSPDAHTLTSAAPAWCLPAPCAPAHAAEVFQTRTKEDCTERESHSVHYARGTKGSNDPDNAAEGKQVDQDVSSARQVKRSGTLHERLSASLIARTNKNAGAEPRDVKTVRPADLCLDEGLEACDESLELDLECHASGGDGSAACASSYHNPPTESAATSPIGA